MLSSSPIWKVGILTVGGLAPCLSSAIAELIKEYNDVSSDIEILFFKNGYMRLLLGDSVTVIQELWNQ